MREAADRLLRSTLRCDSCGGWVRWRERGWRCGVCRREWSLIDEIEAAEELGEPDLPNGIDYERWTPLVSPAPRDAFADSLELDFPDIE